MADITDFDKLETEIQKRLDEVNKMRDELLFQLFSVKYKKQEIEIENRLGFGGSKC